MKTTTQEATHQKGKQFEGEVVSTKMAKTVIVSVIHHRRHPLYRKPMRKTKRFAAHNESLSLVAEDRVVIRETKPISKTKHFIVVSKL